jgi:periplasmic protein TonB
MEAKKNPAYDLSRQRNKFFLIGLSISIGLAISAFEWTTVKTTSKCHYPTREESTIDFIVPSTTIDAPPSPERINKLESKKITTPDIGEIVAVSNETEIEETPEINLEEYMSIPLLSTSTLEDSDTEETEFFTLVEKQLEPINGYKAFYEQLGKMIKYPRQAKSIGTEGKVFVEFIINKNGEPSDFKILKGIGSGCDEEAMRVLAMTKWEPGKQRGKPVRVKMVLPIYFQLAR